MSNKSKVNQLDVKTGSKLRRLDRAQYETAEQMFMAMEAEREATPAGTEDETVPDGHQHKGPVRLSEAQWLAWKR